METLLVRLKSYDPRRGHVLRRYTYAGIKFQDDRGWYRVEKPVAEYLRKVREVAGDPYSPSAFDVCTEAEAQALDAAEADEAKVKRGANDDLKVSPARSPGAVTTAELPKGPVPAADERRGKRERE
jgi:hypothetical protein